jgi:Nif-specific regulatory protein
VVVERVTNEPRFVGRLGAYDRDLPFIATPIRTGARLIGVLAAQPNVREPALSGEGVAKGPG